MLPISPTSSAGSSVKVKNTFLFFEEAHSPRTCRRLSCPTLHLLEGKETSASTAASSPSLRSTPLTLKAQCGAEHGTTVMLRNIPTRYTAGTLVDVLDDNGFCGQFDFVHLPVDRRNNGSTGFGFINLIDHAAAIRFMDHFEGFTLPSVASEKVCAVKWANQQGYEANVKLYVAKGKGGPSFAPLVVDAVGDLVMLDKSTADTMPSLAASHPRHQRSTSQVLVKGLNPRTSVSTLIRYFGSLDAGPVCEVHMPVVGLAYLRFGRGGAADLVVGTYNIHGRYVSVERVAESEQSAVVGA